MYGLLAVIIAASQIVAAGQGSILARVVVSPGAINPTVGGGCNVEVDTNRDASLSLTVYSPDGKIVRALPPVSAVRGVTTVLRWDGRDGTGAVVPDGAFRIGLETLAGRERALWPAEPAGGALLAPRDINPRYYDRERGVLAYDLPEASLVTIEARGELDGSQITASIASEAPRPAGSVIEHWSGRAPSGAHLPSLPGFSIHIHAKPLGPEWVMTYGQRSHKAPIEVSR